MAGDRSVNLGEATFCALLLGVGASGEGLTTDAFGTLASVGVGPMTCVPSKSVRVTSASAISS